MSSPSIPPTAPPPLKSSQALARSGRKTAVIIAIVVIAVGAYGTYFLWRDGASSWGVLMTWAMTLLFGLLAAHSFMPSKDEKLAASLAESGRAQAGTARVLALERLGSLETGSTRQTRVQLTVGLPLDDGQERAVTLNSVYIEDALLPEFATGKQVHVLYDPAAPERVAIDRRHSPVFVR